MNYELILVNDNVLVKAVEGDAKSPGGIIIPDSVEKEIVYGFVREYGEGYPTFDFEADVNAPGRERRDRVYHMPLKVQRGDMVYFFKDRAAPITIEGEKHFVIHEGHIILIKRQKLDL